MTPRRRPDRSRGPSRLLSLVACLTLASATGADARSAATPTPAPTVAPRRGAACRPPNRAFALRLPGSPIALAGSADGCYLFVGLAASATDVHRSLAVLRRERQSYALLRTLDVEGSADALALSADGSLLAVAALQRGIVLLDVARAVGGDPHAAVADLVDPSVASTPAMAFAPDGRHLYAVDRADSAVLAIDVAAARAGGTARSGLFGHRMGIDLDPDALALAPDGGALYVATTSRSPAKNLDAPCHNGAIAGASEFAPEGVVAVIDLAHAGGDGVAPIGARITAGCAPAALAVTADGRDLFVADRTGRQLTTIPATAFGSPPTGTAAHEALTFEPLALGVVDGGAIVAVSGYDHPTDLTHVLELMPRATTLGGSTQTLRVGTGRFPRAMLPYADGSGLVVASYDGQTLAFYPAALLRRALEPPAARRRRRAHPHGA